MRLDQVKTAKGDTFYKLQKDLKNIANTDLTDANGNLRSTYDVILDLSKSWDSLSDMNQAKLLDEVAGKNQAKVLASILQNAKQLPIAYDAMKNSAGSSAKEQARYMDSIEAKTNALKESIKKLWLQTISSDTIKQVVDFLTTLVTSLTNLDGSTVKIIATFTALGVALKSIGTFTSALKGVGTIASLGKDAGMLGGLVKGFSGLGTSIGGVVTTIASLNPVLTGVAVATGIAVAGYEEYQNIMSKPVLSTTTDDLSTFGKMVNSVTGNVIKSKQELIESNSAYEDFSTDLSDNFKNSVEDVSKSFNKLKMSLQFDGEQKVFSDKMSQGIKNQVDDIVKKAKQSILEKKSDVQDTFSKLFTDDDGSIDINESGVLASIGEYENGKFDTIQTLNQNIYDTLNKAVEEHKELTEKDISNIKNWTQQIQALQIQANTGNKFDEEYSSNQGKFEKRLSSMTSEEALSEAKNTYNSIVDINQESENAEKKTISDANTFINQWQSEYDKMPDKSTEKALDLAKSLDLAKGKITQAQDKLNNEVKTRQEQTKKLWDAFYEVNPDKKGKINEINFTEFNGADLGSNKEFNEVMQWYPQVADVTETSMKRIQNANGTWSDVVVTLDETTGKIVSIYDTTTGTVAGYSKKFEDDAEKTYSGIYNAQAKIKALMNDTYSKTNSGSNFKLNNDNNFSIVDDKGIETTIEKMQQVIQLSGGYKVAVANINGTQIKMEFDKNGSLKNYEDVLSAINGDKNSKAVVDFDINTEEGKKKLAEIEEKLVGVESKKVKISVDSQESDSIVDNTIKKLEELKETNPNATITINGEQIPTIDQAIEKLSQVQPYTNTDVVVNTSSANANLDTTQGKVDTLDGEQANLQVNANTSQAQSNLSSIKSTWDGFMKSDNVITKTINIFKNIFGGVDDTEATGTNKAPGGRTLLAEEGMELLVDPQVRDLKGGEVVLNNKSTKNYLEALRLRDKEKENIGHNASGTDNWRGGWTWIDEEGGELVNLPDGTQIIPHDLSEKIIEEDAKNNNGSITVNKVDIYQGITDTTKTLNVSKANLNKPYTSDDNKSDAQKEEEKRLQDRTEKERQYLDDIGNAWENNERRVTNSIDEIELKEAEYGDNISYTDKIDLLNQKYQKQLSLLPIAEKQLNTYKTTIVQTEEAQKDLADKIQNATKTVTSQKKAIVDAYNDIKKANEEMIKSNEDTANSFRDRLVDSIREDLNKQKQAELDKLNDESADKQLQLTKLEAELSSWQKDNSALSKAKQAEYTAQLENLNKEISIEEINKRYDKKLEDKQLYYNADKLLTEQNINVIRGLLLESDTSFKDIGTKLGKSIGDPIKTEIMDALESIKILRKEYANPNSTPIQEPVNNKIWVDDGAKTQIYTNSTGTQTKGSLWSNKIASADQLTTDYEYANGFYKVYDADGNDLGWIDRTKVKEWKDIQSFDTGGMTPDSLDSTGGLAIVHSKERILDANNTQAFNSLVYDILPKFTDNLSSIRNNYNNSTTNESKVEINNEFTISNNHQVQADNLPKNINQLMKQQLLSQGKRTIK